MWVCFSAVPWFTVAGEVEVGPGFWMTEPKGAKADEVSGVAQMVMV